MTKPTTSSDQTERFKQAARELGADESDDALDRVMGRLDLKRKPEAQSTRKVLGSSGTES